VGSEAGGAKQKENHEERVLWIGGAVAIAVGWCIGVLVLPRPHTLTAVEILFPSCRGGSDTAAGGPEEINSRRRSLSSPTCRGGATKGMLYVAQQPAKATRTRRDHLAPDRCRQAETRRTSFATSIPSENPVDTSAIFIWGIPSSSAGRPVDFGRKNRV
jgi:hypothetical protein